MSTAPEPGAAAGDLVEVGTALVRRLLSRPLDEPALVQGAGDDPERLLGLADRLLTNGAAPDVAHAARLWRAVALGWGAPSRDGEAQRAFQTLLAMTPAEGFAWHAAARFHLRRGRWREAHEAATGAASRASGERSVLSTLAVTATALGRQHEAVAAWRSMRIPAEPGEHLPRVEGLPSARLRVPVAGDGLEHPVPERALRFELPWVEPVSPCHGMVATPTFARAPVDFGDVVLWDLQPAAMVSDGEGHAIPCFPLLEVLRRDDAALRARYLLGWPDRHAGWEEALPPGVVAFREGLREARPAGPLERGKLCALDGDVHAVARAVEALRKDRGLQIAVPDLYDRLGDARRAGQEHQAWRGLERAAGREATAV